MKFLFRMPIESQNIEFKESWRDEYQKWICGFANAQGGVLYVGIKDNGEVCGVQDAKKLMEDIPNKVRDMMGILVDVYLKEKDGKSYLEIVTEAYPYPISFRGKYYQRSGATNQELSLQSATAKSIAGAVSGRMIAMLSPLTVEDSCEAKQINLACPCPNPTSRCHALKA